MSIIFKNSLRILPVAAIIAAAGVAGAFNRTYFPTEKVIVYDDSISPDSVAVPDVYRKFLPGEIRDTDAYLKEMQAKEILEQARNSQIKILTRAYGDSIVLRWAAPDFVGWKYLSAKGVNIIRTGEDNQYDTLAVGLKPITLERGLERFPEEDSIGRMGLGLLYNKDLGNPYGSRYESESPGAVFDVYGEQQLKFGFALLACEWRPDVADALAMRFTDKDVKKGKTYRYLIQPTEPDTTGHIMYMEGIVEVENVKYVPETIEVEVIDSVTLPSTVMLSWESTNHSSYDVMRRMKGESEWKRVNDKAFIPMTSPDEGEYCTYTDNVEELGTYEYRILAHDPFGELVTILDSKTVEVRDINPPTPPVVTGIYIDRPDNENPDAEIWADIHLKPLQQEEDLIGYLPFYKHPRITKGEWWQLSKEITSPQDTICRVNVTNLATGEICMGAYDNAGNVAYGIPMMIRIDDYTPPQMPTGFKAKTSLEDKTITLTWDPNPELDIKYYEVVFANDSTHNFMITDGSQVTDTCYVDSISMFNNQKYIYYKVRAVDDYGNMGQLTPALQVVRPSDVPPTPAHLDSASVDNNGVYMKWICGDDEQMGYHHLLRKKEGEKDWTLIKVAEADSVKAEGDIIELVDVPQMDMDREYEYAIISYNCSDIPSEISMTYSALFTGPKYIKIPIKLYGDYKKEGNTTTIVWEVDNIPDYGPYYFSIYRKGPDDDDFKFLISTKPEDRSFQDVLLRPGQKAEYRIHVQYKDGRRSYFSNVATVNAPSDGTE